MSDSLRSVLWPLPEEDITGFTTHGRPMARTASRYSACVSTKRYGEVGRPSVSAASLRMPSRSIVRRAARAVGITRAAPSASSATSVSVWIASISGTTRCGCSRAIRARIAAGSSMSSTCERCATCMAGASA